MLSNSYCKKRLKFPSHIRKFEFSDDPSWGCIIEGKSGHFLTATLNYEIRNDTASAHIHNMSTVKRLLDGKIKLHKQPKKLYLIEFYRGRIKITGKAFSWKRLANL